MKYIDFNDLSDLGLLVKINKDILHPLGLALCRNPDDGTSMGALVADDGVWEYSQNIIDNNPKLNDEEIKDKYKGMEKEHR